MKSDISKKGYYYAFSGIPYAQPPLGDLRFKAPKWVENWSGVLDARVQRSGCVELLVEVKGTSQVIGTEDCLFLNVFTETNPRRTKQLKPVMVYIHGGAFWFGSSDMKKLGPKHLISKDVILVTFNYRLGLFGFLNTEDMASPGNYGLKDQNLVLRWVQKNIRYFGGDPDNVLLFGESAGGASTNFHLLSPKSRGLFHKAILESGAALCIWALQRKPRNVAYWVGVANGITNTKGTQELVDKLRKVDLLDFKETLLLTLSVWLIEIFISGLPFSPSFEDDHDDAFLTKKDWYDMMKNGDFYQVPVIIGFNKNESLYFLQELEMFRPLLVLLDLDPSLITPVGMNISDKELSTYLGGIIKERFLGKNANLVSADREDLMRYFSHDAFVRPIWKTAELMSKHVPLYLYEFRYEGHLARDALRPYRNYPGIKGVAHEEEVYYLFDMWNNLPKSKADFLMRERLVTMWTNFAKYSNPTPVERKKNHASEETTWPLFASSENYNFLEINEPLKISKKSENHDDLMWMDELFNKYGNPPFQTY